MFVTFVYGTLNSAALGRDERQVTWEVLGLLVVLTGLWSLRYCFRSSRLLSAVQLAESWWSFQSFRRALLVRAAAVASTLFLIATNKIPLSVIEAAVVDERLRRSAARNIDSERLREVTKVLVSAQENRIKANPALVRQIGRNVIQATSENPALRDQAWQTATVFFNYCSFLNGEASATPPPGAQTIKEPPGLEELFLIPDQEILGYAVFSNFVIEGGAQTLDRGVWENIIFRKVLIRYKGGPVELKNVRFENCRFEIAFTPRGTKLAQALLTSSVITLSSP